jgi:hypothetical protein
MKFLSDFKNTSLEEAKTDYKKFDTLVRSGLGNASQLQKIHHVLNKLKEDNPILTAAEKNIVQELLNKMVDVVTNNKQIFQQTRRAVKEGVEQNVVDSSDYKLSPSGKKVKAHRIVTSTIKEDNEIIEEALNIDPPYTLLLKREAIRMYPNGTKIALYYSKKLDKYFSVPYDASASIQAEETIKESVDAIGQLQKIKDSHQIGTVNHKDGSSSKVDVQTAHAVLTIHKNLNEGNKKKFADMVARSSHHMKKAADFSFSKLK